MPRRLDIAMKLPSNFDSDAFCDRGEILQFEIRAAEMPRLMEECAEQPDVGQLLVECQGSRVERNVLPDFAGAPRLDLDVRARIAVRCVRCLTAVEVEIDFHRQFVLFASDSDADNALIDHDEFDAVTGGKHMNLEALVEDEVLMALPDYPSHENCPAAALKTLQQFLQEAESSEDDANMQKNPFDALRALKRH
jgi:uncharacterized protein